MFILIFVSLGIFLIVLQTTILQFLPAWLGKPDILFLLVVYLACRADMLRGSLVTLVLGLFMDVFSGVFLGLYPVIYLLVFAFIKGIAHRIAIIEFAYQVPLAVLSYLFVGMGMFVLSFILAPDSPPQWSWGIMLLQLFIIAVIGTPVFGIFDSIMSLYRRSSAAGRLPGARKANRFK
jgi:rod shape-determining protein MreD